MVTEIALTVAAVATWIVVMMVIHDSGQPPPNDTWWPTLGGLCVLTIPFALLVALIAWIWS